jgi:SAM-dependent methyltransferase
MTEMLPCPICCFLESRNKGFKSGFDVLCCKGCDHWWAEGVNPLHNAPDFLAQYCNSDPASSASEFEKLRQGESPGHHIDRTNQLLRRVLGEISWHGTSHLDVGCGSGYLLGQSMISGLDVQGIEPGPWAGEVAKRWQIPVEQSFLRKTHFNRSFDLVTATDVIEHQTNPVSFLELLVANVAPNGLIILTFPCTDSFNARVLGTRWSMVAPPTHCQFFSHQSATKLAERCGLRVAARRQYNAGGFPILSRSQLFTRYYSRILDTLNWGDQLLIALKRATSPVIA